MRRLTPVECDTEIRLENRPVQRLEVSGKARRQINSDPLRIRNIGLTNTLGGRPTEPPGQAGSEHRVDDQCKSTGIDSVCRTGLTGPASESPKGVTFQLPGVDQARHRHRPAMLGEMPGDDIAIPAIVARPTQNQGGASRPARADRIRNGLSCGFHQLRTSHALCDREAITSTDICRLQDCLVHHCLRI